MGELDAAVFPRPARELLTRALSGRTRVWPWLAALGLSGALALRQELTPAGEGWILDWFLAHLLILTQLALPFAVAWLGWAQARHLVTGGDLQPLLLTAVPRQTLLKSAIRRALVLPSVVAIVLAPVVVSCRVPPAYGIAWLWGWGRHLAFLSWAEWCYRSPGESQGRMMLAAVTLLTIHASVRFGVAAGARAAVCGCGSAGSLWRGLALTALPLLIAQAVAHVVVAYYLYWFISLGRTPPWLERLVDDRSLAFYHSLAALSVLAVLPVVTATLLDGAMLRSAARRLDSVVSD